MTFSAVALTSGIALATVMAGGTGANAATTATTTATTTTTVTTPSTPPRAQLLDQSCVQAPAQQYNRSFSVTAVMRWVDKTQRLAVDFELFERTAQTRTFAEVSAPGLNEWIFPSDPPTLGQLPGDVWYVHHPVADLAAPARYRFVVLFRWYGKNDRVLRTETKQSEVCTERAQK